MLFFLYLAVSTFLLLEIGVRLWGYSDRYIHDPVYMPFDGAADLPYVHKPNLADARARGHAVINTDSLGLRAKTAGVRYGAKCEHEYRIAIAGDSVTFGEGIPRTDDTFAQTMENVLNQAQSSFKVRVFNYGTSAYSVREMTSTLERRMLGIQPDLVIMAIIPEDFNLARTPAIDSTGYFVDRRFSRFVPPNSAVRDVLRKVHLAYVIRNLVHSKGRPAPLDADSLSGPALREAYAQVRRFKEVAEQHRLPYAIVLLPTAAGQFLDVPERLERDRISFIALSFLRKEFTLEQFSASRFDRHSSAPVHHRIGEALAQYVLQHHLTRMTPAPRSLSVSVVSDSVSLLSLLPSHTILLR